MGPYPKDIHFRDWDAVGVYPLLEEHGEYMHWETVNPEWWVEHGYCVLRIDSRGTGASPGVPFPLGQQEMADFYDAIEWAASQDFSDGAIAVVGISYFAMSAWRIAAERPPHLSAIIAWEGVVDLYRDRSRHGGILCNTFAEMMTQKTGPHQNTEVAGDPESAAEAIAASRLPPELLMPELGAPHPDLGAIEVPLHPAAVDPWIGAGYGWLRLSHRDLDSDRSLPYRPYHRHIELNTPMPNEVVLAEVEILPTCLVFEPGHSLVLEIGSQDDPRMHPFTHNDPTDRHQTGRVTIHTGGTFDTHLLVPVIPGR